MRRRAACAAAVIAAVAVGASAQTARRPLRVIVAPDAVVDEQPSLGLAYKGERLLKYQEQVRRDMLGDMQEAVKKSRAFTLAADGEPADAVLEITGRAKQMFERLVPHPPKPPTRRWVVRRQEMRANLKIGERRPISLLWFIVADDFGVTWHQAAVKLLAEAEDKFPK